MPLPFQRMSAYERRRLAAGLLLSVLVLAVILSLRGLGGRESPAEQTVQDTSQNAELLEGDYITPLPLTEADAPAKIALGRQLFHEVRLSADGSRSCASCHPLEAGGMDGRVHSVGVGGREGHFNAPTVFNAALNQAQFWDGRAATLEDQIDGPITSQFELASSWDQVVGKLNQDRDYRITFLRLYPREGISPTSIKDALAAFERTLITRNARFDRYLRGEHAALTATELRGYRLFVEYGCASCHQGRNVGGNMYQKLGLMENYFRGQGERNEINAGRYSVTGREEDRHVFKVPSLRSVVRTAPYFHDGSVPTLEQAVVIMARVQLGRSIAPDEVRAIVQFLATLDGEYEGSSE